MLKSASFYFMIFVAVCISIYDISMTVQVGTKIDELNPLARYILMYGTKNVTPDGLACLIAIKSLVLCIISMGTPIYHYSQNVKLNKLMYTLCTVFFIEHLFVLYILTK